MDHQHRDFLRGFVARRAEFHYDAAEHAHARHVFDAHATDLLGLVYNRGAGAAFISGVIGRRNSIAVGPNRGDQLLYSRQLVRERLTRAAAQRRLAVALAALVLVLWPSGSLHRDFAGHGRDLAHPFDFRAQACLWLSRDGVRTFCHRYAGLLRLGPSHVHQRHEPIFGDCVFNSDAVHWRALGD